MYGSFHTCPIMLFLDIFSSLFAKRRRDVKLATEKTVSMIDYGYSRRESELYAGNFKWLQIISSVYFV